MESKVVTMDAATQRELWLDELEGYLRDAPRSDATQAPAAETR